jgi:hypothetical protein
MTKFLTNYPHPNVMSFHDFIVYQNEIKIAMDFVRGLDMN